MGLFGEAGRQPASERDVLARLEAIERRLDEDRGYTARVLDSLLQGSGAHVNVTAQLVEHVTARHQEVRANFEALAVALNLIADRLQDLSRDFRTAEGRAQAAEREAQDQRPIVIMPDAGERH
jgi:hypothetical protein